MSWDGLLSILRAAQSEREQSRAGPPLACPNDGEPLLTDPRTGALRCRADGWEWDGGPVWW